MVSKESSHLFVVVGCIFFLFSGTCQAQEAGPIEIGNADSHQQELLNTAKSVGNTVVQEINAIYGLPENDGEIGQWSDARLKALESGARNSFADRLASKDNFLAIKFNKEKEIKQYVDKDKETLIRVDLNPGVVPNIGVLVYDCKESNHSDFASIIIEYDLTRYRGEKKGEWKLLEKKSGDFSSISEKSAPKCFRPEIFGNYGGNKLNKIEHGDHYHYVPHNRDTDVPVSRFPTQPPGEGEYITPRGEVVEKGNQ